MLKGLVFVLRLLLYGWVLALCEFVKLLCRSKFDPCPPVSPDCMVVDHPAFVRPDPLIYSQRYLLAQGLAVTYDNPDITLSKGGIPVPSNDLEAATTYEVTARVWNNSLEAPVVDMPVHLSFLDFGVGNQPIPVGSAKVDVGVKGSAGQPAFVTIPWTTPATPGHFCLLVQLDPADDVEPLNNLGQENTDVRAAHSPAVFTFKLRNDLPQVRHYHFELDAYQIPPLPRCDDTTPADNKLRGHRRSAHPVPTGFAVQIQPPRVTLDPGASIEITVSVEPPSGFVGPQPINVNVFHEQGYAGGVTLTVKEA